MIVKLRGHMERHFTATAYVLQQDKVLLHYHHKLQHWLPFGGHIEKNETPVEAVIREVKEESGLDIELILQENVVVEEVIAQTLPRPYLSLIENVPQFNDVPAHQHMDLIYLARPVGGTLFDDPEIRWLTLNQIMNHMPDDAFFPETKVVLNHILTSEVVQV